MRKNICLIFVFCLCINLFMPSMLSSSNEKEALPDFNMLWDYTKPEATEKKFKELLPVAKRSGDMSYYTQLLTQIARTQGLQRKFKEAHQTLDEAEKLLTEGLKTSRVRYLLERGRVINSSGEPLQSKECFLKAWELSKAANLDNYAVDALHMLGIVDPPEKQLDWSIQALEIAEKSKDKRVKTWLGPLYNNIGWTYHDLGQYEKALSYFEKGLVFRQSIKDAHGTRIAKWTVAHAYRSLGRVDEALKILVELEVEYQDAGLEQDGYVLEEFAECYMLNGNRSAARKYFSLAYDVLSKDKWLVENEPSRLKRIKDFSNKTKN